jgi:hypothetical protein
MSTPEDRWILQYCPLTAALVGSLVGGVSTFAAYLLLSVQLRAQGLMKRYAEREALSNRVRQQASTPGTPPLFILLWETRPLDNAEHKF